MAEETLRKTADVPEVARMLGVSAPTAWALVHSGRLPAVKVGKRRYVVSLRVLERFLAGESDVR